MRKTRFGGKHVLSSSTQFLCGLLLKNGLMPILCPGNYNYFICFAFWYSVHGEKDNHLTLRFFCSEDESGAKDKTTGKGGGRGKQQLAASAKPATAANTPPSPRQERACPQLLGGARRMPGAHAAAGCAGGGACTSRCQR